MFGILRLSELKRVYSGYLGKWGGLLNLEDWDLRRGLALVGVEETASGMRMVVVITSFPMF